MVSERKTQTVQPLQPLFGAVDFFQHGFAPRVQQKKALPSGIARFAIQPQIRLGLWGGKPRFVERHQQA